MQSPRLEATLSPKLISRKVRTASSYFFLAALNFAHLALAAAAIFARAAGLMVRLTALTRLVLAVGLATFTLAHRAFCAALILAIPAALNLDLLAAFTTVGLTVVVIWLISSCRFSMCSLICTARLSCDEVRL